MTDVDRSEAFFEKVIGLKKLFRFDPAGHTLALMQEAPKGYTPPT